MLIRRSHLHILRQDSYTRFGLIVAGAFGAYALGANNIANVMGVFVPSSPFTNLDLGYGLVLTGTQQLFLLGALAICVGVFTYSHHVINTVGNNLMRMSPLVAFVVVLS
ncbi:MAG: inorganic phosphate transporter [Alphaproteobacteria bacterium]